MQDLFKKFFDNELLTEATKTELETEFSAILSEAVNTAVEAAKVETETKVRTELTEAFVADKEALIEAIDTKTEEFLTAEIAELKESIEQFRDLEAEYAAKLVESRNEMAATVKADMETLVDRLDEFLDIRIEEEMTELKESIEEVKKINFGKRIFEAYQEEFLTKHVNEDATAIELTTTKEKLKETSKVLEGVSKQLDTVKREQKLAALLESLQGSPKEIMSVILQKVSTDKLEETYNKFIGRVLHESVVTEQTKSEKENGTPSVLAEGKDSSATGSNKEVTKVISGDTPILEKEITDVKDEKRLDESTANRIRKLSGILS